jgi:hypothetical protein
MHALVAQQNHAVEVLKFLPSFGHVQGLADHRMVLRQVVPLPAERDDS